MTKGRNLARAQFKEMVNKKYREYVYILSTSKELCLVCKEPSGHWRHWPNVPGEHYATPVHVCQADFHRFRCESDSENT